MFVLARTLTYAAVFVALFLVFLPAQVLQWSGIARPAAMGVAQIAGSVLAGAGAVVAIWCVLSFALIGKGTPAPFDPPRQLVTRGPYKLVRNPMNIGAGSALAGAALFYESWQLFGFTILFFVITHLFVILYEEPTLRRTFGTSYAEYCQNVRRWWPKK